jgi:arginase family enzyme
MCISGERERERASSAVLYLVARGEEDLDLVDLDAQVVWIDAHFDVHLLHSDEGSRITMTKVVVTRKSP